MRLRAPEPDDAADLLAIAREHKLPAEWTWPSGKHGLVVENEGGRVVAFCILSETIYGLVTEEIWSRKNRDGIRGLSLLADRIEEIAQGLAAKRMAPLANGGIIRLEQRSHLKASKKRGYRVVAVVVEKVFRPS